MNWTAKQGNPQPNRTAGSEHPRGAQFAFSDGSVKFLSENIQHTAAAWVNNANAFDQPNNGAKYGVYQRLFSIADGLLLNGY
jgi:prepilin-type processing-associated H-X9-DG protein